MRLNRLLFFILLSAFSRLRRVNLCLILGIVILFSPVVYSQSYNFAWIGDIGLSNSKGEAVLKSAIDYINDSTDAQFVIFSGTITDFSDVTEFENAKSIIKKLKAPCYIIPGNSDVQWSGSRLDFIYTFDNDRFMFEHNREFFIGLSSAITWRGNGGHISPEDLTWLEEQLSSLRKNSRVYLIVPNQLVGTTDNWFGAINILKDYNPQAILCGGGNENQLININQIPGLINKPLLQEKGRWSFTLVENSQDSLIIYEATNNASPQRWMSITKNIFPNIEYIDSTQFSSFDNDVICDISLNRTMLASPIFDNDKIYTADYSGLISCYDTTGNVLWDYDSYGNITSKPVIADGIFAASTLQGDLLTLNAETGEQIQTIGFDDQLTSSLLAIEYTGNKRLLLPKFTDSEAAVVIGTATGKLYCYDLETLQEYWVNTSAKGQITSEPLYINNKIIYGCWDGYLYCVDAREGWLIWKWSPSKDKKLSPAGVQPVTDGSKIYLATRNGNLYAIDLQLGKTIWQSDKFNCWESVGINQNEDRLFVKSIDGKFYFVETKKGNNRKTVNLPYESDKTPIPPIAWSGDILIPSGNGFVYKMDNKFNITDILFTGTASINSLQHIKDNIFLSSNIDGRITLFKIN